MDYLNLKDKTIFDFCSSKRILRKVTFYNKETYLAELKDDKEKYLVNPKDDLHKNAFDLSELAELTGNNALKEEVE